MQRSVVAVLAGFILIPALNFATLGVLARVAPDRFPGGQPVTDTGALALVLVFVAVYGILGCYVTARLAPSRPMLHALILGVLGLAVSIPMTITGWDDAPAWFSVYNLLAIMPYAWIGGRLRETQLARAEQAQPALAA